MTVSVSAMIGPLRYRDTEEENQFVFFLCVSVPLRLIPALRSSRLCVKLNASHENATNFCLELLKHRTAAVVVSLWPQPRQGRGNPRQRPVALGRTARTGSGRCRTSSGYRLSND